MAQYLSADLRVRVISAIENGASRRQAAARFGVSVSSAVRWFQEWRATGRTSPDKRGGDRRSGRSEGLGDEIFALIGEEPDLTLVQIADRLEGDHGVRGSPSAVRRFFVRHGVTVKKRRRTPPSRSART